MRTLLAALLSIGLAVATLSPAVAAPRGAKAERLGLTQGRTKPAPTDAAAAVREGHELPLLAQATTATVDFFAVLAHTQDADTDEALEQFGDMLKRPPFSSFSGFDLMRQGSLTLCLGCDQTTTISATHSLTIRLNSIEAGQANLRVVLKDGDQELVSYVVNIARGATQVVAGPQLPGGTLVLPLVVR